MSQQVIDNSGTTDTLQSGIGKINDNFTELYGSMIHTGFVIDYVGGSVYIPDGWIAANGSAIGNAASGADRANADTENLFILLWNTYSNSICPVSGGRGATAAADFAANKTLTILDFRGKVAVGKQSIGTFSTLGDEVGSETHTLIPNELPTVAAHTHSVGDAVSVASGGDFNVFATTTSSPSSTQSSGGFGFDQPHNNIQPSIVVNKIIKL